MSSALKNAVAYAVGLYHDVTDGIETGLKHIQAAEADFAACEKSNPILAGVAKTALNTAKVSLQKAFPAMPFDLLEDAAGTVLGELSTVNASQPTQATVSVVASVAKAAESIVGKDKVTEILAKVEDTPAAAAKVADAIKTATGKVSEVLTAVSQVH